MIESLTEFFKSLNKKEKIIVISSMSALAVVLISVVLLISFCSIAKHEHQYEYVLDRKNGKFNVIGTCHGQEGDCREREIVLADVKLAETVTKQASCFEEGEILHTYTIEGQDLTYTTVIPKTEHRINGAYVSTLANNDGSFNYDVNGIKVGATTEYKCDGIVDGYYICEDCKDIVSIKVYKPHIAIEITVTPVTCITAGTRKEICKDCSVDMSALISVPAAGHKNTYALQNIADTNATLVATCTVCDAVNSQKVSQLKNNGYVGGTATCAAVPEIQYEARSSITGEILSFVVKGTPIPHKLNGKSAATNYDYGTPGIKYFSDGKIECGTTGNAYFICEVCEGIADVTVTKPAHSLALDYDTLQSPDYENAGSIHYACKNADCDFFASIALPPVITTGENKNATVISAATETTGEIAKYEFTNELPFKVTVKIEKVISAPALGHNIVYSFATSATGVGAYISGVCTNEGCTLEPVNEKISASTKISDLPANCSSPATQVYNITTESGRNLTLELVIGTEIGSNHILNGVDATTLANSDGTYYDDIAGIKFFAGASKLECGGTTDGYYECEMCGEISSVVVVKRHNYKVEVKTAPTTTTDGSGILSCSKCNTSYEIVIDKLVLEGAGKNAVKIKETSTKIVYQYTLIMSADEKYLVELEVPKS